MRRRYFLAITVAGATTPWARAEAQAPRVGFSFGGAGSVVFLEAFREGLRDLGYVEGRTLALEVRSAEGRPERLPAIMKEFVGLNVRVIVAGGGVVAARAAREATTTIPIVTPAVADPVALGLVTSLARPGGNFTGLSLQSPEISGKRLELLKVAVPRLGRVAVLHQVAADRRQVEEATAAARALAVQSQVVEVRAAAEFDAAFAEIRKQRAEAVVVLASSLFGAHRRSLVDRMAVSRLPAIWESPEFADAGGLMSYGPSVRDMYRRAAVYVDKILKGANPGDLPIEQPTKFELVVNLKTARTLGLTVPDALLQRADRVIQ